jgi:hypothetical protein
MTEENRQTEEELAEYYYAHRNDLDDLEEVPPPGKRRPGRPNTGLSATITVRFTPEEAQIIYRLAHEDGVTLSEIVREAVRSIEAYRASKSGSVALG